MGNDQLNYTKCIMLKWNMIYSYQVTLPTKLHMQVAGIEYRQSIESHICVNSPYSRYTVGTL